MQNYSYHTHSCYSDGNNSLEDMVKQAQSLGWKAIGFTDHLIVHKNIRQSPSWKTMFSHYEHLFYADFSEARDKFLRIVEEIAALNKKYSLSVYFAAEVDYYDYDGWLDEFKEFRKQMNFDYCITGNHYLVSDDNLPLDPDEIESLVPDAAAQSNLLSRHFQTITNAVSSCQFAFVAHLDYMRRVRLCADDAFVEEKKALIKTLADYNVSAELSTKGLRKSNDFYPCPWMLEELHQHNVPLVISDDAHQLSELGFKFATAEKCLKQLNYTNFWTLNK